MGCPRYVHFPPNSDRRTDIEECLKRVINGSHRLATCTGKIERGTAVIGRPWTRFSEELPRNPLKQSGLSRPVAGLQEPMTHVGDDYALIVARRNRVSRFN
jgi:hypothetical protein